MQKLVEIFSVNLNNRHNSTKIKVTMDRILEPYKLGWVMIIEYKKKSSDRT